jgi:hypothetical protein
MKRIPLAAFSAVLLCSALSGYPTVGPVAPALAQGRDVLAEDGLRLPRGHRYEQYDPHGAGYRTVRIGSVPGHVRQGVWIYDRTAQEWVSHPSVGVPNPRYAASGRDARRGDALSERDVLAQGALRLPRSHHYERYDRANASYESVRVSTVPGHVREGAWIYDRTAEEWVSHPSVGDLNPQYDASGRRSRR